MSTSPDETHPPETPRLRCFRGAPCPEAVVQGWAQLTKAGDAATRETLWQILELVISQRAQLEARDAVIAMARSAKIPEGLAVAVVGACELLLRQAAAFDLDPGVFEEDLRILDEEATTGAIPTVLALYSRFRQHMRTLATLETLADHGKVLTGLGWRIDRVTSSDRIANANTTVLCLNLKYREGSEEGHVRLQLTTDGLRDLSRFCARFSEATTEGDAPD